jgi:hypothetical protein
MEDIAPRDVLPSEPPRIVIVLDLENPSANVMSVNRQEALDVIAIDREPTVEAEPTTERREASEIAQARLPDLRLAPATSTDPSQASQDRWGQGSAGHVAQDCRRLRQGMSAHRVDLMLPGVPMATVETSGVAVIGSSRPGVFYTTSAKVASIRRK